VFRLCPRYSREHGLQQWGHAGEFPGSNHQIPQRLEFLPARCIEKVLGLVLERSMLQGCMRDGTPAIKLTVGPIVSSFQCFWLELRRFVDNVPGVVMCPIARQHSPFTHHAGMELRAGVRCLYMERRRSNAVLNGPVNGSSEDIFSIVVHTKDKASVDHDAERV